jgi:hypothetical protein
MAKKPPRCEYHLTAKGESLYLLVMSIRQWVIDWPPPSERSEQLTHKVCNQTLVVEVVCGHCGEKPAINDVEFLKNLKGS